MVYERAMELLSNIK